MEEYASYVKSLLFFIFCSILFLRIAQSTGFFRLPASVRHRPYLPLKAILVVFAIYLIITTLVAPACGWLVESFYLKWFKSSPPNEAFGILQVVFLILIFVLFYLYCHAQNSHLFKEIWKTYAIEHPKPILPIS